jgi:membrane associated rhomboid family serine protease
MGFGLPRPPRVVATLLVVNLAVFVGQVFFAMGGRARGVPPLSAYLGVTVGEFWQVWRYFTFQFLHDPGWVWHLVLNMLGLYLLGGPLEHLWGGRRFLIFYLGCGVAAGIAYVIIGALGGLDRSVPLIGASGGVYGILLAAAVLLPHFRVILLVFPVPIRLAAVLIFGVMVLTVLSTLGGGDVWSAMTDVAHLGGAAAAAGWLWVVPRVRLATWRVRGQLREGAFQRELQRRVAEQEEIDRILQKIHDEGLQNLSRRERRTLQEASRHQREQEEKLRRL